MILRTLLLAALLAAAPRAETLLQAVRLPGSSVLLQLPTETDSIYVLDEARGLPSNWTETQIFNGTGATLNITNDLSGSARYFRTRAFPSTLISKPGENLRADFALPNSAGQWSIEGELPEGVTFSAGTLAGSPSPAAAEKYDDGSYTNLLRLTVPGSGEQTPKEFSAEIVQHVKFSFSRNIYAQRPDGPSLGTICLKCHGIGFPPNFSPSASTLIGARSGSGGACPDTWDYIVPGDLAQSLVYQKVVAPPCGDRMPQGGPYFNDTQIDRLARWIAELEPGETD